MPTLTTFLWFDTQAEEAARFYTSLFDDGAITNITYAAPHPVAGAERRVDEVEFSFAGHRLSALNAGPNDPFNESISLLIRCETQEQVDHLWTRLTADGGKAGPCGWLTDPFGVRWQIFPELYFTLRNDNDARKAEAVKAAMLQMGKIESAVLQHTYDNA